VARSSRKRDEPTTTSLHALEGTSPLNLPRTVGMWGDESKSFAIGSPILPTRSGTDLIVNRPGSRSGVTSSHVRGVETRAPGVARTEYGATIVRDGPVCPVST